MRLRAVTILLCCIWMPLAVSFASCSGQVLMQSAFQPGATYWPIASTRSIDQEVRDGALLLKYRGDAGSHLLYNGGTYNDDVEICVNVTLLDSADAVKEYASLVFWAKDYNSYYVLWFGPSGHAGVLRKAGDRWLSPLPSHVHAAVNRGVGQTNFLRVLLHGNIADLFINDRRIGSITGKPAPEGSHVGLRAEGASPRHSSTVWEFSNYIVSRPDVQVHAASQEVAPSGAFATQHRAPAPKGPTVKP